MEFREGEYSLRSNTMLPIRIALAALIFSATNASPLFDNRTQHRPKRATATFQNPSYLPYDNMNAALYGYDLMKADPFSESDVGGGDPGWRNPIFVATTTDPGDKKETVQTMSEYQKSQMKSSFSGYNLAVGNEIKVKVGASIPVKAAEVSAEAETTIPPFLRRSSSNSESESKLRRFFSSERGAVVIMEATCSVQVIDLIPYVVPQFHAGFAEGVAKLATASKSGTEEAKKQAFRDFIDNYGTHYSKRTVMGSKLVYQLRVSQREKSDDSQSDVEECAKVQGLKIFGFQVEKDIDKCKHESVYKQEMTSSSVSRQHSASYGARPRSNLDDWNEQALTSPMPLKMELVPITNLFTPENIEAIEKMTGKQINQGHLAAWFLSLYKNVCEIMYGKEECERQQKGCGINDNCAWDQECKNVDTKLGYQCIVDEEKIKRTMQAVSRKHNSGIETDRGKACKEMLDRISSENKDYRFGIAVAVDQDEGEGGKYVWEQTNNFYTFATWRHALDGPETGYVEDQIQSEIEKKLREKLDRDCRDYRDICGVNAAMNVDYGSYKGSPLKPVGVVCATGSKSSQSTSCTSPGVTVFVARVNDVLCHVFLP